MPKKKTYSSMTKAQKRVAIAKDVILQVKANHFHVKTGIYIAPKDGDWARTADKAFFRAKKRKPCSVCAKGALVCSTVRLFNRFADTIETLADKVEDVLHRNFGAANGDMIECAFEKLSFYDSYIFGERLGGLTEAQVNQARSFGCKYRHRTKRLIAIMKNIIKNSGTFKP